MCTGIAIKTREGNYFWGRTQEYNDVMPYSGIIMPRRAESSLSLTPYTVKYAVVGVAAYFMPMMIDGVNEKGLAGGTFYFGHYNCYAKEDDILKMGKKPLRPEDLILYVLSNYDSVAEIKERLNQDVAIADTPNMMGVSLPQHCVFQDATGASVVIEPSTAGKFDLYDNPIGVFTNSPKFDWHLVNLQNFVGLSNKIDSGIQMGDLTIITSGKGNGLRGIPGDFTPQSRFIRASFLKHFSHDVSDDQGIELIFHLLNSFDIPKGAVEIANSTDIQYTQYTTAYDLNKKKLFIHTYDNRHIQTVCLTKERMTSRYIQYFDLQSTPNIHQMVEVKPERPPEMAELLD